MKKGRVMQDGRSKSVIKAGDCGGFGTPAKTWSYKDRNLSKVSPLKEQFEPTDGDAIKQHHKMAGS